MRASAPQTVALAIGGPIGRDDLPRLYDRVCAFLREHGPAVVLCDVRDVEADAVAVEALARLQLGARRHGCQVRLRHASRDLVDLVAFMGLADVLTE